MKIEVKGELMSETRIVIVYKEDGRYGGWPANHGSWNWGDEIVVGLPTRSAEISRNSQEKNRKKFSQCSVKKNGGCFIFGRKNFGKGEGLEEKYQRIKGYCLQ